VSPDTETSDLGRTERSPAWALTWKVALGWAIHLGLVALLVLAVYGTAAPLLDGLDEALLRAAYRQYSERGAAVAEAISLLGQPYVAVPTMTIGVAITFVYVSPRAALFIFLVYFFAGADYLILNQLIGRPRPHLFEELPAPVGFGTPSGHSTATMALFGSLAAVVWRRFGRGGAWLGVPLVTTFVLVGATRVYLQVHRPSDVLLAWLMTGTWMWIVYALMFRPRARASASTGGGSSPRSPRAP